jgi:hypothetical protein
MPLPSSAIIIIVVLGFAFYLMYTQQNQSHLLHGQLLRGGEFGRDFGGMGPGIGSRCNCGPGCKCGMGSPPRSDAMGPAGPTGPYPSPHPYPPQSQLPPAQSPVTNIMLDRGDDPYSDAIKKQDLYTMYDPLTYPQLRLPREVLDRYNEYYERTGTYPPFNQSTQPYLFDNPVLNGVLIKVVDDNEPFTDNIPNSIPLFRVKSVKNANRYFYYIIDQRYLSKVEPKIPLDNVKVNGVRYHNVDFYGIPELFDGDMIEHISIYPSAKFKVTLYKTYHFP